MQLDKFIQQLQECPNQQAEVAQIHIEKDMFRVTLKNKESTIILTNKANTYNEG